MSAKPTTISDLATLPSEPKHIRAHRALLHQTPELQITIYTLDPGGRIPAHQHTASWDISVVLEGEIEACFMENGTPRTTRCALHAINLVPPGAIHEISNPSTTQVARFLLIQSPSHAFDFLPASVSID